MNRWRTLCPTPMEVVPFIIVYIYTEIRFNVFGLDIIELNNLLQEAEEAIKQLHNSTVCTIPLLLSYQISINSLRATVLWKADLREAAIEWGLQSNTLILHQAFNLVTPILIGPLEYLAQMFYEAQVTTAFNETIAGLQKLSSIYPIAKLAVLRLTNPILLQSTKSVVEVTPELLKSLAIQPIEDTSIDDTKHNN